MTSVLLFRTPCGTSVAPPYVMKIRLFVSASAVVLAAWLGVTFFRQVPHENYHLLGKASVPVSAAADSSGDAEGIDAETAAVERSRRADSDGKLAVAD